MNRFLPTIAALSLIFSSVSCKENTSDSTIEADEVYETPVEVIETPAMEEVDTTVIDTAEVDTTVVE